MGVSDRAAAAVASALLEDLGVVTHDDMSNIIDRHKIRRERKKNRMECQDFNTIVTNNLKGLYFDGRKDQTLTQKNIEGMLHQQRVLEEHVPQIEKPGYKYVGHLSPINSSAKDITKSITKFSKEHHIHFTKM